MVKIVTLLPLLFIFVLALVPLVPIAQAEQAEQIPGFSVSIRSSSSQNGETSPKEFSGRVIDNGTTTTFVVSGTAVSFGNKDFDKDGYPHELSIFFDVDVDSDGEASYYAVFYLNFYGDWFTDDNFISDIYSIENGYSPTEGIYLDLYFFGYSPMTMGIKVEIYRENGSLACVYGPDDNTGAIPFEGDGYDVKKTLSSPPQPQHRHRASLIRFQYLRPKLNSQKKTSSDVTVTVTGANGCAVEGESVTATINSAGNKRISISPSSGETDENGQAIFTITAKKTGNARVTFSAGDLRESILVKVTK